MAYYSPFRQENIMNNLLDAYGAAQKIRQRRNEEEVLKSIWNNDPSIQQNFDKDETLLGRLFGTGLRTIPKEREVTSYNVPNTVTNEESYLPVRQMKITTETPKEEISESLLSKGTTKKDSVSKEPATSGTGINTSSLLGTLGNPRAVNFRSTPEGVESFYPVSTEQMVSDMFPEKESYFTPGSSLLANLYGG